LVSDISNAIRVVRVRDELQVSSLERWVDAHIISRIPGSGHAGK
jgi:hypothetical protein